MTPALQRDPESQLWCDTAKVMHRPQAQGWTGCPVTVLPWGFPPPPGLQGPVGLTVSGPSCSPAMAVAPASSPGPQCSCGWSPSGFLPQSSPIAHGNLQGALQDKCYLVSPWDVCRQGRALRSPSRQMLVGPERDKLCFYGQST